MEAEKILEIENFSILIVVNQVLHAGRRQPGVAVREAFSQGLEDE